MAVTDTNDLTSTSTLKLNITPLKNRSTQILNWIMNDEVGIKEEVDRNIFTEKEHKKGTFFVGQLSPIDA